MLVLAVDVAQLVEPRVVVSVVVGSSPIIHPISKKVPFRLTLASIIYAI